VPRTQSIVVALSIGLAAVFGVIALTKTVHLGQAAAGKPVSSALVAKRNAQLDRFEASLRAELRHKPPAIPKLPPAPAAAAAPVSAQRVVYVRPAPVVIHKHRADGEHESEGSGHGDGGGGGDD
jgi:hypothetical protein